MSKQGTELPYAQKCHGCHADMKGSFSDPETLCTHCKCRLGGEESTNEGKR